MRQVLVGFFLSFLLLLLSGCHSINASLLPFEFVDRHLTDLWLDPFRVLEQMPFGIDRDGSVALSPTRVDWKETPDSHMIMIDVPGLTKEEIKIELLENRVLRVSGERKREESDQWHRVERSYGKFCRQFRLPYILDLDSAKAKLENGVLNLSFDKLSPDKIKGPRVVSIEGDGEKPESVKLNSNVGM